MYVPIQDKRGEREKKKNEVREENLLKRCKRTRALRHYFFYYFYYYYNFSYYKETILKPAGRRRHDSEAKTKSS